MTEQQEPFTVSVADAATLTGLSQWTIRDLVNRGELAAFRHGRRILVHYAGLRAYVENLEQVAAS